ncbi:hypothetical protein LA080_015126 [Diaporthe eres]|nr:hypothetical protein LA080_015126 [Diaporthe eres]
MKFAKRRRIPAFGSSAFRPDFAVSTRHHPRQDDAMPDNSRNLGDDPSQPRVREQPPIAEAEILYAARLQHAVTEATATPDLASGPAALPGFPTPLTRIVTDPETLAETGPIALVICSLDTSTKALEAPLGVARLHIPPIHASRPLTSPGILTPTSLSDSHHDHDHLYLLSDGGVAVLFPLHPLRDALVTSTAREAVVGRPLHPAVEIFRTIQTSVPSAREHLRIATTAPRHYLVAVSRPLPLAARDPRRRLADAGDQYRTTCLGTHSSRRTIERGTTIRGRKPGLLRQELDEHLSRPSGRGGLIACHLGDYHPSQHPARTVLKSICRREAISVAHTVSPYNTGGRGNWGGQQQYSPQSQYPPQFPPNGYAPTAPAAHFQGSQANSPPVGTPTGPSHQFSQSPYRGGYRGSSSGGYRGNSAGSGAGRGASRGGFKSGHWGSSGSGSRAASSQPEDAGSGRATPQAGSSIGDQGSSHGEAGTHENENPFRPPKEFQVEDTAMDEGNDEEPMPAPATRPPPTGPAAEKKISFALKSTPKAPVTAPKFEISSKFNAPTKKDPPKESIRHDPRDRDSRDARESRDHRDNRDNRDNRDHRDHRDSRDIKGSRDHREHAPQKHVTDGRDLPRNVPTEPRAAKEQQRRQEQQKPREPREPRVRMVKKKMKRLKEKPVLPDHLAASDSVYFRKPGNESVIGAGTYGKVFKALHVYTKKLVALKRIRMEGERDGFPVTAVREIKLLQSLKHINIVALLEVMVEKNECYMVFEYMSHDLTGILNHPTFKLEAAHRKHLSKQLFEGLDYLHQRGVLHRDIKAANILVSSDGILKLADFGLARFYAKRHQLDYTNRVITIWYRSPELLLGETQYSPAVDIWSAACVMIEIFTRRAVFPGDGGEISQLDKIYSVLGTPHKSSWPGLTDMPWFELLRPGVRKPNVFAEQYEDKLPPAAFKLMSEMLQYDPLKRPTAAHVLEHPYFTTESPAPRQAVELQHVDGDWHEFESKALRRENERKDREARKAAEKGSGSTSKDNKDSRKRPPEASDANRETKRQHVEEPAEAASGASEVIPSKKA